MPEPSAGVVIEWVRAGAPVPVLVVGVDGSRVWHGSGEPGVIEGAGVRDLYLDVTTGLVYVRSS